MSIHSSVMIHPTSIVDEGASIGERSKVWHWTHISSGAVIGKVLIWAKRVCGESGINWE